MLRRTKIVATLGPASNDPKVLDQMIEAGVDVVRLNFSHGSAEEHVQSAELVRSLARTRGRAVGVLVDLQGPKIRIGRFKDGKVTLKEGDRFVLDADCELGDQSRVGLDYPDLVKDVSRGSTLLLDDGRIEMWVEEVQGNQVITKVVRGGTLSNNKGINRKGGGLSASALTDKDIEDIRTAAQLKADYLAVSFPRSAADIQQAREILRAAGGRAWIVAKIERVEAIDALPDILNASDAIMVARGDLGVEVGDAAVPALRSEERRVGAGAAEEDDPACAGVEQAGHHRHADDGVHDREPHPHPCRGVRRGQRRAGRHRRGHALGRDGGGQIPHRGHRSHAPGVRRGGEGDGPAPVFP